MKSKTLTSLLLLSLTFTLFQSCEKNNPTPDTPSIINNTDPPKEGNLVIINYSNYPLVLLQPKAGDTLRIIEEIPNSSQDFPVKVTDIPTSTQGGKGIVDLRLRRVINGEIEAEDFKRWEIALSTGYNLEDRVTWFVSAVEQDQYTGYITPIYLGGTDYQVEIFMDNRTGAKLTALKAGDQFEKIIGLGYGVKTILYRYFKSDQGNANGQEEIGWIEKEIVNGAEDLIQFVINDSYPKRTLIVPHFEDGTNGTIPKGILRVENKCHNVISVHVGSDLIENVVSNSPQNQARSFINLGQAEEYNLPASDYYFIVKKGSEPIATLDTTIVANETIEWEIQ